MKDTSTLILAEKKKNLIKNTNDTSNHTVHQDFTLESVNRENQHSFVCSSLLLSYSIRIKGYMSNLGPHLRHNQHHTLLHVQEQPCSQSSLHMHEQQPTSKDYSKEIDLFISLYGLTTLPFIGFTIRKTLNTWSPKIVTN
jgi:hypothetical protein